MPLAVSAVIWEDDSRVRVLAVRRPEEAGESFAGMWGLPAVTVGEGETPEDAVRRLGQQKLGMTLEVGEEITRGSEEREDGELTMVLLEATAMEDEPKLVRFKLIQQGNRMNTIDRESEDAKSVIMIV